MIGRCDDRRAGAREQSGAPARWASERGAGRAGRARCALQGARWRARLVPRSHWAGFFFAIGVQKPAGSPLWPVQTSGSLALACEECKRRNYQTQKSKRNNPVASRCAGPAAGAVGTLLIGGPASGAASPWPVTATREAQG